MQFSKLAIRAPILAMIALVLVSQVTAAPAPLVAESYIQAEPSREYTLFLLLIMYAR
jgi:hypothetical protein